jgi:hypothetical protein
MKKIVTNLIILMISVSFSYSQAETPLTLEEKIEQSRIIWLENRKFAEEYALENGLPIRQVSKDGEIIEIQSISDNGIPLYYITHNANAARTVGVNRVYSGGGAGLSLSGDGITLGIWDGGGVRTSHQEFTSSRATQRDSPSGTSWHATHVSGTMIGAGVVANAKGMSYAADLDCYEWNNDVSEMRSAAGSGLKVSNHSYGFITGWHYNSSNSTWYWYGNVSVSTTEDAYFGFYSYQTSLYDDIAYDNPNYLICSSAGNDRNDGPSAGTGHYYISGGWVWSTATREKDGGTDGYDCLPSSSVSKNVLVVGAVEDITSGYNDPSDVVMTDFSSWGPTDDGRIKPDIVANGSLLYSAYSSSNSSYVWASGTSMACPNTSGALGLLLEHHKDLHGSTATMRSATLKGIVIHTAHEAGSYDGPDYKFGWGLLNIEGAADLMTTNANRSEDYDIQELTLSSSETEEITGYSDGTSPIRVTICWTDPAASYSSLSLNNRTSKLVNDLDLRITRSSNTYYPYKLSYSNPGNAATTGDNDVDNVEQIYIDNPTAGNYTISIDHEGSLTGSSQDFSIMITGLEPVSEPVVTSQPEDSQVCPGASTFFVAEISGEIDNYLWYFSDDDGSSWYEASDADHYTDHTTSTLTIDDVSGDMSGYLYKVRAENSYGTTYSDPAELSVYQNATISSHPMSQDLTAGENTYFSVTDVGGDSYRWQVSNDNGDTWSYISNGGVYSNATTSTLNLSDVPILYSGYWYRAEVSNVCGFETYSNAADIYVGGYVEITSNPDNIYLCIGNNDVFYCTISGVPDPTLQWQVSTDDGETWNDISDGSHYSGYNTSQLTVFDAIAGMNGNLYRLKAQNDYETVYSNTAELFIYPNATISSHPMSQDITAGEDTYFSVTDDGGESYRWQVSVDDGDTWSYISNGGIYSNATTSTLNLNNVPISYSGYWYRAEVSNICGFETYSNAADINVSGYIEVFYHPDNYTTCIGEDGYLYAVIWGEPDPALQWQISTNDGGSWSNISNGAQYSGVTTNTLTIYSPSEDMQDHLYRLTGTNTVGSLQTNGASVFLEDELVVYTHPTNASVSAGDDHTFTADIGDPLEMNWQISTDNGNTWNWVNDEWPYSGIFTQSLYIEYITADMDGYLYRLVGYGYCPDGATTNAAELTVETSLSITSNPDDTEACRDAQAFFECNVESNPAPEMQWQVSTDNGSSWTGLSDNDVYDGTSTETLEILSTQGYMAGFLYRLYATNNFDEAVSEAAELHITPVPLITEDLSNQNACEGGEAVFEFQVDGDNLSYTWYYSTDNGTSWIEILNNTTFSGANTNALTINIVSLEMDNYMLFCMVENPCEDLETTDFVGLNVLESTEIIDPVDQETCNGGTVEFSASVSGSGNLDYLWQRSINSGANWSNLSNNDIFSGVASLILTIEGVNNQYDVDLYRLRVISDCGTSYSQAAQLSVTNPILVGAGEDIDLCYGEEANIDISVSGGVSPYQYYWTPSTGLSSTSISNPTAQPTETTTYTVYVTDSEGCQGSDEITINVNPQLFANAGEDELICFDSEVQLNGSADGGSGVYQYSWSPSDGLDDPNSQNPIASPLETTEYTLTVTDNRGCTATDQVTVELNPQLYANAGDDEFICYGSEVQLNGSADGGSGVYQYSWSPTDGLNNSSIQNPIASPTETTIYILTVTDNNGCTATDQVTVELNPQLYANAGDDEFICYGSEVQLNGSADGGSGVYQYTWSPSDGLDDPNIQNPIASPFETTEYTLTVTDSEGCLASDIIIVNLNPELFVNAGDDEFICYGSEVELLANVSGGSRRYNYSWSPTAGLNDPEAPNPIASPTATTEYTVTVTDTRGCVVSDVMTVEVNPELFVNAGSDEFICYGSEVQLQGSISGGDNDLEYSWSPSTGLSDPNILNPVADPTETTTYTLTVIDGQGCSKTDEVIVEVNPELIASSGSNKNLCYGGEVQLDGSASGGNGQYQYSWSPSTGLSSTTIATPLASPLETITYTLTVTDGEGCVSVDEVQIEVNNAVFVDAGNDLVVCYGSEEQFDIIVEGGTPPYNYYWTPADGLSDQFVKNPVISPNQAATTYTVYVTDSQNCSGSDEIVVSLNPELFANAGNDEFICYGSEVQLNGSADGGSEIYQYSWTPVDGLDDPNSPDPIANPTITTEYTLTITDSEGCVVSDVMTVEVNPELFANAGDDVFICYSSEVQLNGSADGGSEIYQYSWTPVDGLDDPNSPDPVANPTVTTEYTLTITDSEGCVVSDVMTVVVNPELFANAGDDEFICYGSEVQLNGSADGGSEIYQYSWTPVDGLDDPNSPDPVANPTVTTEYTLTITDSEGCVVSDVMTVVVNPELFANAGDDEFICYGSEVQLNGSADGGSEIYQYSWTPVDGLDDPSSPAPVANPTVTTEYTLTITDSEGCVVSDVMTVVVNPELFVNAGDDEFICFGSEVQLNGSADGGSEIYQYSWTPVDGLDDPNSPDPVANPTVTTEYTLTITDSEGCVVSDVMTVEVNPELFANAGDDEFICYGSEVQLNGSADGGSEIYQYSWTPVDGLDDPNSPDPVANPTVTTEYTLTITDSEGCVVSDVMTVVVNPELFVNAGDDEFICYGSEVQLNGSADGGSEIYQYSWTPVDGLDDPNIPDPVANPTVTTEYTLTITDSEGCVVSDVMTVEVNPELFANAGDDEFICYGSEVQLNGSADGGSEIYQYSWTPVDGLDDPNSPDPVANPTVTTEYTLTITDSEGCVVSDVMTVEVNPELFANAGDDEFICYGSEVQLNGSADGGSEIYQYSWTPVDGLDDPNSPDPVANPTVTTEYTLTITDSEGCIVSDVMTVEVNPELFANAGDDEFICYGSEVQLNGSADGGSEIYQYSWTPVDGLYDPNSPDPVANPTVTTEYTLTITDSEGCVVSDVMTVVVNPELFVNTGDDEFICYGSEVQLNGSADGGSEIYQYSWTPIDGLNDPNSPDPIANPTITTEYTLTITDSEGCVVSDVVTVVVNPELFANAGDDEFICYGSEVQLNGSADGGSEIYQYSWTPVDGLDDPSSPDPVANPTVTTEYTLIITDSEGCVVSDVMTVVVNPELFANAGDDEFICYGSEVQLNGSADGGSEIYQYSWTPVDGLDDPNSPDPVANPTVTTEYTLTITDSEGCVVSDVMTVVVNPELFVNAGDDEFICYGSEVQLNGSADGGSEIYQYSWTPVDGLDDPNSPDPVANPTITTEYTLTITDSEGCVVSDVMTVTVNPLPEPEISGDEEVNSYTNHEYTTEVDEIMEIEWIVEGGIINGSNSNENVQIDWGAAGTGKVKLILTNSETGCTDSTEIDVQINLLISLNRQWNWISSYLEPESLDLDDIFEDVIDDLLLVRDRAGNIYFPSMNINTIGEWDISQGYKIFMMNGADLVIKGEKLDPEDNTIYLNQQWNMISYIRDSEMDINTALESIIDDILIVRDVSGNIFMPELDINSIDDMIPTQAYDIYLNEDTELTYPENDYNPRAVHFNQISELPEPKYLRASNKTTSVHHTFIVELSKENNGNEIAIYNKHDEMISSGVVLNGFAILTVWGDDDKTPTKDGPEEGELLTIKVLDQSTKEINTLNNIAIKDLRSDLILNELFYQKGGIVRIQSNDIIGSNQLMITASPNPVSNFTTIEYYLPYSGFAEIMLYSSEGKVIENLIDSYHVAGTHSYSMDVKLIPSGKYSLVVKQNDRIHSIPLLIVK